jgi:hypothetical protein
MRIIKLLLVVCFISFFQANSHSQIVINDTMINASEHAYSYEQEKRMILAGQSSPYLKHQAFLVALNNKLYKGEYLDQIISRHQQEVKRLDIIRDRKEINKYTTDPAIQSIISIKVDRRKAKSIYQRLREKGIVNLKQ